jgi:hypothetical protein
MSGQRGAAIVLFFAVFRVAAGRLKDSFSQGLSISMKRFYLLVESV